MIRSRVILFNSRSGANQISANLKNFKIPEKDLGEGENIMKNTIIIVTIITTLLTIALIAIYDLEAALTAILIPILIGLIVLTVGTIWNGVVQIKAEVERRKRIKKKEKTF